MSSTDRMPQVDRPSALYLVEMLTHDCASARRAQRRKRQISL